MHEDMFLSTLKIKADFSCSNNVTDKCHFFFTSTYRLHKLLIVFQVTWSTDYHKTQKGKHLLAHVILAICKYNTENDYVTAAGRHVYQAPSKEEVTGIHISVSTEYQMQESARSLQCVQCLCNELKVIVNPPDLFYTSVSLY